MTGKSVYVTTDYREKQLQRALLQFSRPENANLVREALKLAGREDLIGSGQECLVRAAFGQGVRTEHREAGRTKPSQRGAKTFVKPAKNGNFKPNARKHSKNGTRDAKGAKSSVSKRAASGKR
jgi:hypothetical protein